MRTNRSVHGILSLAATLLLSSYSHGEIHRVPADFGSIQSAIDAASPGDQILVSPGTYTEAIRLNGKGVELNSLAGPDSTVIQRPDDAGWTPTVRIQDGETSTTIIAGFTIRNGSGDFTSTFGCNCDGYTLGGGIFIQNASPVIRDCVVTGNRCGTYFSRGGGIYIDGGVPLIERTTILANSAQGGYGSGGGIFVQSGSPIFADCLIRGNSTNSYHSANCGGIAAGAATFRDCIITGNSTGGSIGGICTSSSTQLERVYVGTSNYPTPMTEEFIDNGGNVLDGDCNGNGLTDDLDISNGTSIDLDADGLPDECLCRFSSIVACCQGDLNRDGTVDSADLGVLLAVWNTDGSIVAGSDINADGLVSASDLGILLGSWGVCP